MGQVTSVDTELALGHPCHLWSSRPQLNGLLSCQRVEEMALRAAALGPACGLRGLGNTPVQVQKPTAS